MSHPWLFVQSIHTLLACNVAKVMHIAFILYELNLLQWLNLQSTSYRSTNDHTLLYWILSTLLIKLLVVPFYLLVKYKLYIIVSCRYSHNFVMCTGSHLWSRVFSAIFRSFGGGGGHGWGLHTVLFFLEFFLCFSLFLCGIPWYYLVLLVFFSLNIQHCCLLCVKYTANIS